VKLVVAFLLAGMLQAQGPTITALQAGEAGQGNAEQTELNQAVSDAGNSPVDYIRVVERHLAKYPDTSERAGLEKGLAKAAMETNDNARIILYGIRVLNRESQSQDDSQLIERVIRALIDKGDASSAATAGPIVKRYEADIEAQRSQQPPGHLSVPIWSDLLDANMAAAIALEANVVGNLGDVAEAVKVAEKSWATYPSGEGARTAARWLSKAGRNQEAIEYYAEAFTYDDPRTTPANRVADRARLGELYRKVNGSEKGLGEFVLAAYDHMTALRAERTASLKTRDPNSDVVELGDFTLPTVEGSAPLRLSSLKGKVVVMDFWATWCIPCREQHPLIENVKKHFADSQDVVFLSVDADDDRTLVAPFLKEQSWGSGYFEAGLARRLGVTAIPTIFILNSSGQVASEMTGVEPKRFESELTERIEEARNPISPK
jgi:cytochrome c biogenesis protein CcmG/thiol:disulfide interchange protein DsbE